MASTKELQAEISDLQETIGQALEVLQESYEPAATRTDLAEAVGDAIAILSGEDLEDETDSDEEDEGE
jgi:hypothetical protein